MKLRGFRCCSLVEIENSTSYKIGKKSKPKTPNSSSETTCGDHTITSQEYHDTTGENQGQDSFQKH